MTVTVTSSQQHASDRQARRLTSTPRRQSPDRVGPVSAYDRGPITRVRDELVILERHENDSQTRRHVSDLTTLYMATCDIVRRRLTASATTFDSDTDTRVAGEATVLSENDSTRQETVTETARFPEMETFSANDP